MSYYKTYELGIYFKHTHSVSLFSNIDSTHAGKAVQDNHLNLIVLVNNHLTHFFYYFPSIIFKFCCVRYDDTSTDSFE